MATALERDGNRDQARDDLERTTTTRKSDEGIHTSRKDEATRTQEEGRERENKKQHVGAKEHSEGKDKHRHLPGASDIVMKQRSDLERTTTTRTGNKEKHTPD